MRATSRPARSAEIDGETWRKAWDVKVFGYVDLTRIIYPHMCARRSGVIINIVGAAARTPNHRYIAGCMRQHRAQHVHPVPGRREHAPRRARRRHQSRADGARPPSPARHGARQAASRRREPLAGAAREISRQAAPARPRRSPSSWCSSPPTAPASSAAPRSISTAGYRCFRATPDACAVVWFAVRPGISSGRTLRASRWDGQRRYRGNNRHPAKLPKAVRLTGERPAAATNRRLSFTCDARLHCSKAQLVAKTLRQSRSSSRNGMAC